MCIKEVCVSSVGLIISNLFLFSNFALVWFASSFSFLLFYFLNTFKRIEHTRTWNNYSDRKSLEHIFHICTESHTPVTHEITTDPMPLQNQNCIDVLFLSTRNKWIFKLSCCHSLTQSPSLYSLFRLSFMHSHTFWMRGKISQEKECVDNLYVCGAKISVFPLTSQLHFLQSCAHKSIHFVSFFLLQVFNIFLLLF